MLANTRRNQLVPGFGLVPSLANPHGLDLCLELSQNGQTGGGAHFLFIVANTDQ